MLGWRRGRILPQVREDPPPSLGGNIMELTAVLQAIAIVITGVLIAAGIAYVAAVMRRPRPNR